MQLSIPDKRTMPEEHLTVSWLEARGVPIICWGAAGMPLNITAPAEQPALATKNQAAFKLWVEKQWVRATTAQTLASVSEPALFL